MTNRHQPNRLFENDGNGYFKDVAKERGIADSREGHGAVFLDADLDGDMGELVDGVQCVMLEYGRFRRGHGRVWSLVTGEYRRAKPTLTHSYAPPHTHPSRTSSPGSSGGGSEFVAMRTLAAASHLSQNEYAAHFGGLTTGMTYRIKGNE